MAPENRGTILTREVALPLWLFLPLVATSLLFVLLYLVLPLVQRVLHRRSSRVLDELESSLRIKIQPFKLTRRRVLIDRLRDDPVVVAAAEAHARENGERREVALARVEGYAREIVPSFNAYFYFRTGYWLAKRVVELLYRVRLGWVDERGLLAVPDDATVVFVINHRSNVDYLLVAYLVAEKTALSYAVGEWARVWPLQTLIRGMGAYFVRRGSRDALYRRVLERYIQMATAGGLTQAVFPEGRLSRNGALDEGKTGLIDYMLRGFDPDGDRDLVFVPVGVNYDRTLEDRTLLLDVEPERAARPAVRTSFRFALRQFGLMARGRWFRFGYACANLEGGYSAWQSAGLETER